jgi:septum formation protein
MIYLASQSPRRRELLDQIGVPYRLVHAEVDETPGAGESAEDYVRRMAIAKARAGHHRAPQQGPDMPVLGADTAVVLDGHILGKPRDREHGLTMLAALAGREHRVLTGIALVSDTLEEYRLSDSRVTFRALSDADIAAYWASGEPADKAGGYAVQGLGAVFIAHLSGSYSGVMGLPLFETAELLGHAGFAPLDKD